MAGSINDLSKYRYVRSLESFPIFLLEQYPFQ